MKSLAMVLGFFCGLFLVVIAFAVRKAMNKESCIFDERQKAARGMAFKWGFITAMACMIADFIVEIFLEHPWAEAETRMSIEICIPLAVFVIVCVMKDAYLSLNESVKQIAILFVSATLMNITMSIQRLDKAAIKIVNGKLCNVPLTLPLGITLIIVGVTFFGRLLWMRSKAQEE